MSFKEYVQHDICKSFMNQDEFASTVNINGVAVVVVEDKDQLLYRIKKNYDGLVVGDVLFSISEAEYAKIPRVPEVPKANVAISYNGSPCTIVEVNPQEGIYEITLLKAGGY